jgi:hypothetical protein
MRSCALSAERTGGAHEPKLVAGAVDGGEGGGWQQVTGLLAVADAIRLQDESV